MWRLAIFRREGEFSDSSSDEGDTDSLDDDADAEAEGRD